MKFRIFFIISLLFWFSQQTLASFGDIPDGHSSFPATEYLQKIGVLTGYEDNTFRLDQRISRAELLSVSLKAFQVPVTIPSKTCFRDVKKKDWFYAIVCTAKDLGMVKGYKGNRFRPNQTVTRAEALAMIMASMRRLQPPPTGTVMFKDVKAKENFEPEKFMTRGETAEILYRILTKEIMSKPETTDTGLTEAELKWQIMALDDVNQWRKQEGKPPLKLDARLSNIAKLHSEDMGRNLNKWSHEGSLGEDAHERIRGNKVPDPVNKTFITVPVPKTIGRTGENVGMRNVNWYKGSFEERVQKAIRSQHKFFMNEPHDQINHRTIMLSIAAPFDTIGIGLWLDEKGNLWITEDFISTN